MKTVVETYTVYELNDGATPIDISEVRVGDFAHRHGIYTMVERSGEYRDEIDRLIEVSSDIEDINEWVKRLQADDVSDTALTVDFYKKESVSTIHKPAIITIHLVILLTTKVSKYLTLK